MQRMGLSQSSAARLQGCRDAPDTPLNRMPATIGLRVLSQVQVIPADHIGQHTWGGSPNRAESYVAEEYAKDEVGTAWCQVEGSSIAVQPSESALGLDDLAYGHAGGDHGQYVFLVWNQDVE
jgi:hypothetical protein